MEWIFTNTWTAYLPQTVGIRRWCWVPGSLISLVCLVAPGPRPRSVPCSYRACVGPPCRRWRFVDRVGVEGHETVRDTCSTSDQVRRVIRVKSAAWKTRGHPLRPSCFCDPTSLTHILHDLDDPPSSARIFCLPRRRCRLSTITKRHAPCGNACVKMHHNPVGSSPSDRTSLTHSSTSSNIRACTTLGPSSSSAPSSVPERPWTRAMKER